MPHRVSPTGPACATRNVADAATQLERLLKPKPISAITLLLGPRSCMGECASHFPTSQTPTGASHVAQRAESFLADRTAFLHDRYHPHRSHHRADVDPPRRNGVWRHRLLCREGCAESRIVASRQRHLCCRGSTPRATERRRGPSDDSPRVAGALRGVFRHRPGEHAVSPVAARKGVSEFWRQRLGVGADIGDHRRERKRDLSHRHDVSDDGQSRGLLGMQHQQLDVG